MWVCVCVQQLVYVTCYVWPIAIRRITYAYYIHSTTLEIFVWCTHVVAVRVLKCVCVYVDVGCFASRVVDDTLEWVSADLINGGKRTLDISVIARRCCVESGAFGVFVGAVSGALLDLALRCTCERENRNLIPFLE